MTTPATKRNDSIRRRSARLLAAAVALTLLAAALPAPSFAGKEPKKRVAVSTFQNQAGRQWRDVGNGMSEMLVSELLDSGKFVVLERQALGEVLEEHGLAEHTTTRPDAESRLTSAQALVRGTITHIEVEEKNSGSVGMRRFGVKLGRSKVTVRVGLGIKLIDVATGQILESELVEGQAAEKKLQAGVSYEGIQIGTEAFDNTPIGEAVQDAIGQATDEIISGMALVPWQGSVVKVSGRQVFVNAGRDSNVEQGMRLVVFEKGQELIDPETNENLGRLDEEIGLIEIVRTASKFSIGRVVKGEGFARGNVVKPDLGPVGTSL